MSPSSYANPMWRDAMREILQMLDGEPGDDAEAIRAEARLHEASFDRWLANETAPPSDEERRAAVKTATSLFKRTRELLRERAEALRPRPPEPSHPGG